MTFITENNVKICVCDGAELNAVKKGINNFDAQKNIIILPMGITPVSKKLNQLDNKNYPILIIGLGGSLNPNYQVGDVVIYESCSRIIQEKNIETKYTDRTLNNWLKEKLNAPLVKGITTHKLIHLAQVKKQLSIWGDIVDMESFAVMSHFQQVSIIRIVSDNYNDNLPDLNKAINQEGKIDNLKMLMVFMQSSIEAVKLIKNSLKSLKKIEKIGKTIFN